MIFSRKKGKNGAGKRAKPNSSGICGFTYRHINSFGACSYTYSLKSDGKSCVFGYNSEKYGEFGGLSCNTELSLSVELDRLCRECAVERWNGYDKYDPYIRDGSDFSLKIVYNDAGSLSAKGSNAFPDGYADFCKKLDALFKPYADALVEEAIRKKIARGVSGELTCYFVNFIQKGQSGEDSYKFMIAASDIKENNVDIAVNSTSGEIFPKGEYRCYGRADNAVLKFDKITALIDKYGIVKWDYYDKAAKDVSNSEWFQLTFVFSSEERISAMGTEHPPLYDEFRKEFLELMLKLTSDTKTLLRK